MSTVQSDLETAVALVKADSLKLHDVVHGDASSTVTTDNGEINTVAKALAAISASSDSANIYLNNLDVSGSDALKALGCIFTPVTSDDMNDAKEPGIYRLTDSVNVAPNSAGGHMLVLSTGVEQKVTQIAITPNADQIYIRAGTNVSNTFTYTAWAPVIGSSSTGGGGGSTVDFPTGFIAPSASSTTPTGWLKCNGAQVSRTNYSDLFSAVGEVYGAGDGSTTFELPDIRGEFIRGWDDGRGIDSGRTLGSFQDWNVGLHGHSVLAGEPTGIAQSYFATGEPGPTTNKAVTTSGNPSGENRPRNVALPHYIKY